MRVFLFLTLFLITNTLYSQCFDLLSNKLDSIDIIPYVLYDKVVFQVKSGQTTYVKLNDVSYKTKLAFLFQSKDLGDTLKVSLITLNSHVLTKKIITKDDYMFRYQPMKKTENYFLMIETKQVLDEEKRVIKGCYGIAILERVTKKPFKSLQKIEWKY